MSRSQQRGQRRQRHQQPVRQQPVRQLVPPQQQHADRAPPRAPAGAFLAPQRAPLAVVDDPPLLAPLAAVRPVPYGFRHLGHDVAQTAVAGGTGGAVGAAGGAAIVGCCKGAVAYGLIPAVCRFALLGVFGVSIGNIHLKI